jgi:hypothetical protein
MLFSYPAIYFTSNVLPRDHQKAQAQLMADQNSLRACQQFRFLFPA